MSPVSLSIIRRHFKNAMSRRQRIARIIRRHVREAAQEVIGSSPRPTRPLRYAA
jgi:hypothetical protein